MIKAIAIDDEPLALKVIESLCKENTLVSLEKTFSKPNDALKYINNFPVDLIFLDIHMPSISGIDFYKNLDKNIMVIFTTAFSEYAVEGFNLNAVDYLVKPITEDRFQQAVSKAHDFFSYNAQTESPKHNFIYIRADYSLLKINYTDIIYVEGLNDYVKFHLQDLKPIVARMTLKNLADRLPDSEFVRVHRSYIVPTSRINAIRNKHIFIYNEGKSIEIPIGKSYEEDVYKICK
ncbi:MAG: LytTR family DNA-binding domain-containing protein [Chitinophagaceae bacterium]